MSAECALYALYIMYYNTLLATISIQYRDKIMTITFQKTDIGNNSIFV